MGETCTWRSDPFHAKGGIDTEKFGRADRQDLNWSTAKFIVPEDVNYESLRVSFSMITAAGLAAQMVVIEICSLIGFHWIKNFSSVKRVTTNM